ncbi:MAG: gluconate 2-dehydrogenase subunit 3 family protein [Pseudomonadota bacterium]
MSIPFHRRKTAGRDHLGSSRRMFLMTTAMAGVTTGVMMSGAHPVMGAALSEDQSAALLRMVQDIYPHPDLLDLSHYQAIVDGVIAGADGDADVAAGLQDGLKRIDEQAEVLFGTGYVAIEDPDAREGLLRHFQHEGFFQNVRWAAYFGIYNNPEVWPLFGYQGSSVEHGGYIDRGFSDITFVPQGPSLEERMAEVQS